MKRNSVSPVLSKKIFERDGGMCVYCGGYALQLDHVIPVSKGGINGKNNLVCVCRRCNYKKAGNLDMDYITRGLFWLMQHGENVDWVDKLYAKESKKVSRE